jgi:hypothetical protein
MTAPRATARPLESQPDLVTTSQLLHALEIATNGFRHNEVIVQARMQNFLVADSILLLGWTTLYAGSQRAGWTWALAVLALLSLLLSLFWAVLGMRQGKFLKLQMDVVCRLEAELPEAFRITSPVRNLQDNKDAVRLHTFGTGEEMDELRLTRAESQLKSRNLLVWTPLAFAATSVTLLLVTLVGG